MSLPRVPPRPSSYEQTMHQHQRQNSLPPPIPPLPPDLRYSTQSPPHYDQPLAAPKPYRADPSLPANMAQSLEAVNYNPGFIVPNRGPSPLPPLHHHHQSYQSPLPPPPQRQPWNINAPPPQPYAQQQAPPYAQPPPNHIQHVASLEQGMHNLSFSPQQHPPPQPFHRTPSMSTYGPPPKAPTPPRVVSASAPSLTAPLPTIPTLLQALPTVQQPSHDPTLRIAWARDVVFLLDRDQHVQSNDIPVGPATISDPQLLQLAKLAIPVILELASLPRAPSPNGSSPVYIAEAVYWRATFEASGAFPDMVKHDPRSAFRDFEAAARAGYHAAWFRLGRDYENFNDQAHAKDCFERGVKYGVESCLYRMGMAHLMGQLGLAQNIDLALPLLHRAATLSSLTVPQPAYVYSLLLLGEFTHPSLPPLPPSTFTSPHFQPPLIPPTSTPHLEARKHLERSAYLHFPPAQYKLGHFYEFATPPFPFDALLSVQYYSLASQQGEVEADMALSKWFLCGCEGEGAAGFDKDETLAWTFADKAARKGLPSAMFAMGYYAEVGVGGPKDLDAAIKWYKRAADSDNADAKERLTVLTSPSAQPLSRQEHDTITEAKLVRKRTQAKQRSEARPAGEGAGEGERGYANTNLGGGGGLQQQQYGGGMGGQAVIENIRRQSLDGYARTGGPPGPGYYPPTSRMPPLAEHPSYNQPPPPPPPPPPQQQQSQSQHSQHPQQHSQQQLPNISPRIQHTSPPAPGPIVGGGGVGNTTGTGLRPQHPGRPQQQQQQQQQQQFPGAQRYTLIDPGSGSPPPAGMGIGMGMGMGRPNTTSPRPGPGPSRAPSGGNAFDGDNGFPGVGVGVSGGGGGGARPNKTPGPTTFAEMGFQGAKAEDKECVIM